MRVAVLVPEWHVEEIFLAAFARSMGSYQEPSGTLYVAAALERAGHEVLFADGALLSNEAIVDRIAPGRPAWVGMYVCAALWPSARRLLEGLRAALPDAVLAIGGPWAATMARESLAECSALDQCFTGEGEEAAVEAIAALMAGAEPHGVRGLVFRARDGSVVDTGWRDMIENLDALPFPARHLLGDDIQRCALPPGGYRARPVAHLIASRGCTNRCIYCFHMERERGIRYRSAAGIVDEVETCVLRHGFREVRFLDDNFTGNRDRVLEICDLLEARRLTIPWYVSSRVDTVDPEMLRRMKRAGCWAMLYGIETGVQKNLDAIGKNVTLDRIRATVAMTKEAGIEMFLPFMFGIPGETFEEGLATIDFAIELDPYYANFNTLTPFPGTWLWEHGDMLGCMSRDPARMTFQGAAFVPRTMTEAQIVELRRIAFRRFYSRPRFVARWLRGATNRHVVGALVRGIPSFATMWLRPDAFQHKPGG